MTLSPIYLQKLAEVREQGRKEKRKEVLCRCIEALLRFRFGSLDEELNAIIEPLFMFGEDVFIPLALELSKEELLNKFSPQ
jgi:hypothetical protein